jgi:hypothetical protein
MGWLSKDDSLIIIVTCTDIEAEPFLRSLPKDESEQMAVVAPRTLGGIIERMDLGIPVWVVERFSSVGGIRRRLANAKSPIVILVGLGDRGLSRKWPSIRRRLVAPWLIPCGQRADVVGLLPEGTIGKRYSACRRLDLLLRFCVLDVWSVYRATMRPAIALVVGLSTFARLLPLFLWTEARAWLLGRNARESAEG